MTLKPVTHHPGTSVFQAGQDAIRANGDRLMLYLVEDATRRYGRQPGTVTYADAQGRVGPLIAAYRRLGLNPGSRVALGLDNRPEFFYHWLALNALRTSAAPLNPHWQSAELEYVLEHSDARLAAALPDRVQAIREAAPTDCRILACDGPRTAQGDDGITVNMVAPSPIEDTEMFHDVIPKDSEISRTVLFFLDDDAGFVTGQTLFVCGGTSLGGMSFT